jgi:tetratricopeptide (TPR) repeat protein
VASAPGTGTGAPAAARPGLPLRLAFAVACGTLLWSFVAGLAYFAAIYKGLPMRVDPLTGARERARRGDIDGAVRQYQAALVINPGDANVLVQMGDALLVKGRYDAAWDAYEAARQRSSGSKPLIGLADVRLAQNRALEAIDLYNQVVAREPHNAAVLNNLGMAYAGAGNFDRAIASFEAAVALSPDPGALANLNRARSEKAHESGGPARP